MKLSNIISGRDNNFNIIRMIAALAVLITHAFALAIGTGEAEPFRDTLGMTMGSIAVDVFFVASGFLVAASLLTGKGIVEFFWARFLRLFPALLVMLLLTVFGLGIFFTSLPLNSYLTDTKIYIYLLKNVTLIMGVGYQLPGVFEGNPFRNAVNGSLWTMPFEIKMYGILAVIYFVLRAIKKINSFSLFGVVILISAIVAGFWVATSYFYFSGKGPFAKLFFMFFSGAAFYVMKERIVLSKTIFCLAVTGLIFSPLINKDIFFVVYLVTIAYVLFYMAYVPSGFIRRYNQVGDYSYGLYIYSFPVQQTVAALIPGVSVLLMLVISTVVTFLLAALSWHLIERRVLNLKKFFIDRTRVILSVGRTSESVRAS